MQQRQRFKQTESLTDRLAAFAKDAREKADNLPPCNERDEWLKKARQADVASHLDDWASSPGLRQPK